MGMLSSPSLLVRFVVVIPAPGGSVAKFDPLPPTIPFYMAVEKRHVCSLVVNSSDSHWAIHTLFAANIRILKCTPPGQFHPIVRCFICRAARIIANRDHIGGYSDFGWFACDGISVQGRCFHQSQVNHCHPACIDRITEWTVALNVCWIQVAQRRGVSCPTKKRRE